MLHYESLGSGRAILILHGARLDHRHMMETLEPLFVQQSDWQRIYVDLPGHGKSPADPSIKTQEDVLQALIRFAIEAFPGAEFAVIGESRGGYLAQGFAYLRPDLVTGLLLIVPGGRPDAPAERLPEHVTLVADPALRAALPDEERPRFDRLVVQNAEIMDKTRRTKMPAVALSNSDMEDRVQRSFEFSFDLLGPEAVFEKPCLIVAGRQDAMSGYADAIECLAVYPRASLAILDTAGHAVAWERPDLFLALAGDWLGRLLD